MDLLTATLKDVIVIDSSAENQFGTTQPEMVFNVTKQMFVHKCHSSPLLVAEQDTESSGSGSEPGVDCQRSTLYEKSSCTTVCRNGSNGRTVCTDASSDQQVSQLSLSDDDHLNSSSYASCIPYDSSLMMLEETVQSDVQRMHCSCKLNDIPESDGCKKVIDFGQEHEENSIVITSAAGNSKQSLLLRLFESKLFNMSIAIQYLFNSKEPGVLSYLGK
jgi:hypothetical protein